jgi:O-acetyl-ADP-ribose deacetylase (regulator of RNase III)
MKTEVIKGDITEIEVDAIVNAAKYTLMGGGGVDGAIHAKGGSEILEECKRIKEKQGGCPTGEAVFTTAGKLKAKIVIHTVGPIWHGGTRNEEQLLEKCYVNSLKIAEEQGLKSIAFPNISTGVYNFPKDLAAEIAMRTVKNFPFQSLERVVMVCFDEENFYFCKKYM